MTIAERPLIADPEGSIGQALDQESPDVAAGKLLEAIRSREGREKLGSALATRLGDREERQRRQAVLTEGPLLDSLLFQNLAGAMTLKNTYSAARELVRIMSAAGDTDTSTPLMARAMGAVLEAVTGRSVRPDHLPPAPAAPQPRPSTPREPSTRSSAAVPASASAGDHDLTGAFKVPDGVVRAGPDGGMIVAPLYVASGGNRGPGPVRVPSALPPPPDASDPELIRGWLRGVPAFTDSLGVRAGLLDSGDAGDLMELEAEFHADPKGALRLYRAAAPISDGTPDAAWCARLGHDLGRFGVTHDQGVAALAEALRDHPALRREDRSAPLVQGGAVLVVREELAEAVCGLLDAEADFLEDGPGDTSGPPQNLLGAFSAKGELSRPGMCLERALTLHLSGAVALGTALRQAVTEFRIAQALRDNPDAPVPALDARFEADPAMPLAELAGRAPIVRIGWSEPALAGPC